MKLKNHNQGQSLIAIIIILVIVGLITAGLYYYLRKQIPEGLEIIKKPTEKAIKPEEEPIVRKCPDGTPDMHCSITKPLYCQNLELVNDCARCGCPEDMVCQTNNNCAKRVLGNKIYILKNGDPKEKLDLLFIPHNISDFSIMRSKINDILYKNGTNFDGTPMVSLFNIEPFKNYKDKFNVAYVDANINPTIFDCEKLIPDPTKPQESPLFPIFRCDDNKITEAYEIFEPDYIIVLFNEPNYTSIGGLVQYLNINLESSNRFAKLSLVFVHEFGHQFGGLADEYVITDSPSYHSYHCGTADNYKCFEDYEKILKIYPNLDTLGCPKWCKSYDINRDAVLIEENKLCAVAKDNEECKALGYSDFPVLCTWFELKHPFFNSHCVTIDGIGNIGIDCENDAGCFFGGDYGQLAFNPGSSIMRKDGTKFNGPSREHLESILKCCYPRKETDFCINFRNKFQNLPDFMLPYERARYNKIFSCP